MFAVEFLWGLSSECPLPNSYALYNLLKEGELSINRVIITLTSNQGMQSKKYAKCPLDSSPLHFSEVSESLFS